MALPSLIGCSERCAIRGNAAARLANHPAASLGRDAQAAAVRRSDALKPHRSSQAVKFELPEKNRMNWIECWARGLTFGAPRSPAAEIVGGSFGQATHALVF